MVFRTILDSDVGRQQHVLVVRDSDDDNADDDDADDNDDGDGSMSSQSYTHMLVTDRCRTRTVCHQQYSAASQFCHCHTGVHDL